MSFTRCSDSCSMSLEELETYPDILEYLRRADNNPPLVFTILSYLKVYKDVFSKESFEQLLEY